MYAVLGANGRAGGAVALALLARGEAVRVILRDGRRTADWHAAGAEVALAEITELAAMTAALSGVAGAFLLNPPPAGGDPRAESARLGTALAAAASAAGLRRAVLLSSVGAQHAAGTGVITTLHQFEALLGGIAPATTILRAGYFIETWGENVATIRDAGIMPSFIAPEQPVPMVSTVDIGQAAADLLTDGGKGRRIVELAGPKEYTPQEVASAFSTVLGRAVDPVFVPADARMDLLFAEGVPTEIATALLGMYEGIARGIVTPEPQHPLRRGTTALTAAIARITG